MFRKRLDKVAAEQIAVEALSFLSRDDERLERFLALSGLSVDSLRAAAASQDFLSGVLDYIVSEDQLIVELARNIGLAPEAVLQARNVLSPTED